MNNPKPGTSKSARREKTNSDNKFYVASYKISNSSTVKSDEIGVKSESDSENEDFEELLSYSSIEKEKLPNDGKDKNTNNATVDSNNMKKKSRPNDDVHCKNEILVVEDDDDDNDDDIDVTGCSAIPIKLPVIPKRQQQQKPSFYSTGWSSSGSLKKIFFTKTTGLPEQLHNLLIMDYFNLLFDEEFFDEILKGTNFYGCSHVSGWKLVKLDDIRFVLAILITMDTVQITKIQEYWNKDGYLKHNLAMQYMTYERFISIMQCMHFATSIYSTKEYYSIQEAVEAKMKPLIDFFNTKMTVIYYPKKELVLNEMMATWKGSIEYGKYSPGIKLHLLSDSNGIVVRMKTSCGQLSPESKETVNNEMIMNLMCDFLNKGHALYLDLRFTNFPLMTKLLNKRTYCTGLISKSLVCDDILNFELNTGRAVYAFKDNIIMGRWKQESCESIFASTEFRDYDASSNDSHRPLPMIYLNTYMSQMDDRNQMIALYINRSPELSEQMKILINIIEILLINAYHLYKKFSKSDQTLSYNDFRYSICKELLLLNKSSINVATTTTSDENLLNSKKVYTEHFPLSLPRDDSSRIRRKRCRYCYRTGLRKNTNFYCKACPNSPGLCLPCFSLYHELPEHKKQVNDAELEKNNGNTSSDEHNSSLEKN